MQKYITLLPIDIEVYFSLLIYISLVISTEHLLKRKCIAWIPMKKLHSLFLLKKCVTQNIHIKLLIYLPFVMPERSKISTGERKINTCLNIYSSHSLMRHAPSSPLKRKERKSCKSIFASTRSLDSIFWFILLAEISRRPLLIDARWDLISEGGGLVPICALGES